MDQKDDPQLNVPDNFCEKYVQAIKEIHHGILNNGKPATVLDIVAALDYYKWHLLHSYDFNRNHINNFNKDMKRMDRMEDEIERLGRIIEDK